MFIAGGLWLIISGSSELTTRVREYLPDTWSEETYRVLMKSRSQSEGSLKVGIGLGLLGAASLTNESTKESYSNGSGLKPIILKYLSRALTVLSTLMESPEGSDDDDQKIATIQSTIIDQSEEIVDGDDDYNDCVKLFLDRVNSGQPLYSKCKRDSKILTLVDKDGRELAKFKKKKSGKWYMPFWLN